MKIGCRKWKPGQSILATNLNIDLDRERQDSLLRFVNQRRQVRHGHERVGVLVREL